MFCVAKGTLKSYGNSRIIGGPAMSLLPHRFLELHEEDLLAFIKNSFKKRYDSGGTADDDTPIGNNPSFILQGGKFDCFSDWRYEDRFYGSEPFGGIITIFYKNTPCFVMTVQGKIVEGAPHEDAGLAYDCLTDALRLAPPNFPFRGPSVYVTNGGVGEHMRYSHNYHGSLRKCYGKELIMRAMPDGTEIPIFECDWFAQVVNLYLP